MDTIEQQPVTTPKNRPSVMLLPECSVNRIRAVLHQCLVNVENEDVERLDAGQLAARSRLLYELNNCAALLPRRPQPRGKAA